MDKVRGREYNKDEIIDIILGNIKNNIDKLMLVDANFDDNGRLDSTTLAVAVLEVVDGIGNNLPYMDLDSSSENTYELNGVLHDLIRYPNNKIERLFLDGTLTSMSKELIYKIKDFMLQYENGDIKSPHQFAKNILDVIDNGIDGKKFELVAKGFREDILEAKSRGYNYFPEEPVVISGGLAKRYKEISKDSRANEKKSAPLKMDKVLKGVIKHKGRITMEDVKKIPGMFMEKIGKLFSDNNKDENVK